MKHLQTFTQHINESEEFNIPEEVKEVDYAAYKRWRENGEWYEPEPNCTTFDNKEQEEVDLFHNLSGSRKMIPIGPMGHLGIWYLGPDERGCYFRKNAKSPAGFPYAMTISNGTLNKYYLAKKLTDLFRTAIMTSPLHEFQEHLLGHYVEWIKIK